MTKAQSAMEYLLTYGMTILIIGVALAALFALGVFNATGASAPNACIAQAPYACSQLVLTSQGTIEFLFGQASGQNLYNVELACLSTSNSTAQNPGPSMAFTNLYSASPGDIITASNSNTTLNSQAIYIGGGQSGNGLPCYDQGGLFGGGQGISVGTQFTGILWVNYTTSSGAVDSVTNPWRTVKVATLSVKATFVTATPATTTSTSTTTTTILLIHPR